MTDREIYPPLNVNIVSEIMTQLLKIWLGLFFFQWIASQYPLKIGAKGTAELGPGKSRILQSASFGLRRLAV